MILSSVLVHREEVIFFSFSKIIPSLGGGQQKKYFVVTHRVQGEVYAKFGWDTSSSLGSKSEQTNKQTDRHLSFIYIDCVISLACAKCIITSIAATFATAAVTIASCSSNCNNNSISRTIIPGRTTVNELIFFCGDWGIRTVQNPLQHSVFDRKLIKRFAYEKHDLRVQKAEMARHH